MVRRRRRRYKPDNGFVKKGVVRERELEERARALHLFWGN